MRVVKKVFLYAFLLLLSLQSVSEARDSPVINAKSYIIMDAASGAVLKENNEHLPLPPASMTKMMTGLILFDKIKSGEVEWEESVMISPRAAKVGEAGIDLFAGRPETLRNLFRAMWVRSANNASVALAEHVAGSEENFVTLMNQKAKDLSMKNTHYANVTGLDEPMYVDPPKTDGPHIMSAYDTALLCRYLLKNYPEVLSITSQPTITLDAGRIYPSWNEMLPGFHLYYPGVDGMKTGHTDEAGFCFASTAKKNNFRLITVVMDTPSKSQRFVETGKLLNEGFEGYTLRTLARPSETIKKIPLARGKERTISISVKKPLKVVTPKGEEGRYILKVIPNSTLRAPIKKGAVVGKVVAFYEGKRIEGFEPVHAVANESMEKGNWFYLFFRTVGDKISSLFSHK